MYRCRAFIISCIFALSLCANSVEYDPDEETFFLLKTLIFETENETEAIDSYKTLYEKTNNPEYLKEAIKIAYVYKSSQLDTLIKKGDKLLSKDSGFLKIKSSYLVDKGQIDEALDTALELTKLDPNAINFAAAGMIESSLGYHDRALEHYKKAYELDSGDLNLIRVANLLLTRMNDVSGAISYLESHRAMNGCSVMVCSILLDIYKQSRNYPMILAIDEELFELTNENKYMDEILGYYIYEKDYDSVIKLLEKYSYNDKLLVEIYAYLKEYDKAINLAEDGFESSKDREFLALKAMMTYEKNMPKVPDEIVTKVSNLFKDSVDENSKSIYQNYYGYLLIDHDIDAKKGVEFVKNALKTEPNSPYYLDSLAWGYYKLGECEKAKEIMDSISLEFTEFWQSDEAKEHLEKIDSCLKGEK